MSKVNNHFLYLLFTLTAVLALITFSFYKYRGLKKSQNNNVSTISITPTPFDPFPYKAPTVPNARSYRIMLVGDSMIESLGPNTQLLRQHLIELYPKHEFVNYNFSFGSTNIKTLPDRLTEGYNYIGTTYPSVLSQGFDLIIIGSFAYNPLSDDPDGLSKHIKILDESVRKLIEQKPKSAVAILLPIAPSKENFAKGVYDLSPEQRKIWALERISYINAVSTFAKSKEIPLIDVYNKSLDENGGVDLKYINKDDYIHPSVEGVDLMAKTIAEFIYDNKIFPE